MAMYPEQEGVFFQLIVQGGGEFVYDSSGNLRSSNVGQVTTDPQQGITCQQGFATYNGHGAVITLLSTSQAAFFQYQDLGTAVQGTLILAIASAGGNDPVKNTAYQAGMNGIDPAFGDFLVAVGATINLGQASYTRNAITSAHVAADNAHNPYVAMDAPEQGTAKHLEMLLQGASPDGTRLGQLLIGQVAGAAVLSPITQGMLEVQGQQSNPPSPILQVIQQASADNSLGIQVSGDTANRLRVAPGNPNGAFAEGPGNATQDVLFGRTAANLFSFLTCDVRVGTAGRGLRVAEGSNAKQGLALLSAGTVVVATTAVTANSRIFLTAQDLGTVTVPSALCVSARTAGTSFTIKASQATDTSHVAWEIFEPG